MMTVGMLWLDADKQRSLTDKVRRAIAYYQDKYGREPELCLVNDALLEDATDVDAVHVEPAANIQPHHFWLGLSGDVAPDSEA